MPKYENLHAISPDLFVAEIEKDIAALAEQQQALEQQLAEAMAAIRELSDSLLERNIQPGSGTAVPVQRWQYDVRFPNYVLDTLYAIENATRAPKRWVGPERALEFSVMLDRWAQYELTATVIDFINEDVRQEFVLTVDDEEVPWLEQTGGAYIAVIPEDFRPRATPRTWLALGPRATAQAPAQVPGDARTLWYSLASIGIRVLGVVAAIGVGRDFAGIWF